ncbi:MAG TPA: hypothetical protein VKK81_02055 [Candidatus Binatia bacterium]|nr:hypothetical protein [Candidatus Binatia bacterium]
MRYGGSAAAGATVTFTMKKADGRRVTGTATAHKKGQTVWSYRVGTNDPAGTYSVTSTAGYNSQTASSTTVNFTVQ